MVAWERVTRRDVLRAIHEYDRLGRGTGRRGPVWGPSVRGPLSRCQEVEPAGDEFRDLYRFSCDDGNLIGHRSRSFCFDASPGSRLGRTGVLETSEESGSGRVPCRFLCSRFWRSESVQLTRPTGEIFSLSDAKRPHGLQQGRLGPTNRRQSFPIAFFLRARTKGRRRHENRIAIPKRLK
jgi:hypothetical protein